MTPSNASRDAEDRDVAEFYGRASIREIDWILGMIRSRESHGEQFRPGIVGALAAAIARTFQEYEM